MKKFLVTFFIACALALSNIAPAQAVTYVNSVSQQTCTIAASATTGTVSLGAPTGTYFFLWNGYTTTDATTDASSMPRITFAANTITCTRGTSSAATIAVNLTVVDATASLVKTVQFGTTAFTSGQASNTSSISAVTNTNTALEYLGQSTAGSQSYSGNQIWITLSGTTVTATKQFAGSVETAAWEVVEFQTAALAQSTQPILQNATRAATTWTSTLTSLTAANSMLFYGGISGNTPSNPAVFLQRGTITNATTETTTVNTTPSVTQQFAFTAVSFASGVLSANGVQRGTITTTAATSNTATVTAVGNAAVLNWVGNSSTTTTANAATSRHKITLTNSTTITDTVNTSGTGTSSYELIDFAVPNNTPFTGDSSWFSTDGL